MIWCERNDLVCYSTEFSDTKCDVIDLCSSCCFLASLCIFMYLYVNNNHISK